MVSVDRFNLAWNEVTEKCIKGVWRYRYPDLSKDSDQKIIVHIDKITKLANETDKGDPDVQDIEKSLNVNRENLTNEESAEQQEGHEEDEISDSKNEYKRIFQQISQKNLTSLPKIISL